MELSENIKKIKDLIIKNNLKDAREIFYKSDFSNTKDVGELNIIGSFYYKEKNYNKSSEVYLRILDIEPNYIPALLNLGVLEQQFTNYTKALEYFNKTLSIDSQSWSAYNNIGFILNKQKQYDEAITNLDKSININSKYAESHFNIGCSYYYKDDYQNAEKFFKLSLDINLKFLSPNFYLGEIYRSQGRFKKALDYFIKSRQNWTTIRVLECLLILGLKDLYNQQIDKLAEIDSENRRIAAATSYFSHKYKIENNYNFCKNPLNYITKFNLLDDLKLLNLNIKNIYSEIKLQETLWEIPSRTTINGITTKKNLSELNLKNFNIFQNLILQKLNEYKKKYSLSDDLFIKKWPNKHYFNSWSNTLKKEGYNKAHIHPSGWLSGVFYLDIPENLKNKEGGIEFSLHGYDFIKGEEEIPHETYIPKIGELILFPSSLHHKTIPFDTKGERVCIAFDFCKISSKNMN